MTVKTKTKSSKPSPGPVLANPDVEQYPFLVKVLITFTQANSQGVQEKKKEAVVFKLEREAVKKPNYVLRNYLVPNYLTSKYGPQEVGWHVLYEIKVMKIINRQSPNDITDIPLRVMTMEQLDLYCERWGLNVNVTEFYSVEKAREMVALRMEDEKGYQKHLGEYREGKKRTYPELDNLRGNKESSIGDADEFDKLDIPGPTALVLSPLSTEEINDTPDQTDPFGDV
jgi:hypothetical protein